MIEDDLSKGGVNYGFKAQKKTELCVSAVVLFVLELFKLISQIILPKQKYLTGLHLILLFWLNGELEKCEMN